MTRLLRKGDRIRLLVPTVSGWKGEGIVAEDQSGELIAFYPLRLGDDPTAPPSICVSNEVELA